MNNKEKIVKRLLFEIIDKMSKDADVYNHNGSLWLINTDSTKWIFEFTKSKTLWYNYNFFRSALKFVSLDINEGDNQKYITEWFESRYLNINQVKHILEVSNPNPPGVEDTIQNGVKHTTADATGNGYNVEDTIQNGVKRTHFDRNHDLTRVEDTIQNGVKRTVPESIADSFAIEDTIKNGVKETKRPLLPRTKRVEDAIENGVKDTKTSMSYQKFSVEDTIQNGVKHTEIGWAQDNGVEDAVKNGVKHTCFAMERNQQHVDDTIQNGVKNTWPDKIPNDYDWSEDFEDEIIDVIQEGVKEIQPLPAQDGNMDWGLYYQRQEDRTKPHTEYVRDVIEEHHHRTREVVVTIKDGVKETHQDCSNNIARVEGIIRVGEKLD